MYRPLCLCSEVAALGLKVRTKIIVLMHWRENKLTTNTAGMACLALPRSEIHLRGLPDKPLSTEKLLKDGENAALLFPTDDALELNAEWVRKNPGPLTLIVPDGSWRQARKVAHREEALKAIPRVTLPMGDPSNYRLRHSPHRRNLSTFEAISRAMGVLEGQEVQEKLDSLFLKMVERILWSRGKLPPENALTEIPKEAILAARIAGALGGKKSRHQ